jgi:uracil-DNA glycosylase family 4
VGFLSASATASVKPLPLLPQCNACGLYRRCNSPKMKVYGRGKRKILIVGQCPADNEDEQGIPFVGKAGKLLRKIIESIGYDLEEDCWTTNSLRCFSGRDDKGKLKKPTPRQLTQCHPYYAQALRELKPNVVIPLGKEAITTVLMELWKQGSGLEPTKWVGWNIPCQKINAWICPNYHPSFVCRMENRDDRTPNPIYPVVKKIFTEHLRKGFRNVDRPYKTVPKLSSCVTRLLDPIEGARRIRAFTKDGKPIAIDFETETLKPDGPYASIYCCGLSDGETTIAYPWDGEAIEATKELLLSKTPKIIQNLKMEYRYAAKVLGIEPRAITDDPMQKMHVLDNRKGITGLKFMAFVMLGIPPYNKDVEPFLKGGRSNGRNRIRQADLGKVLEYVGMDALFTARVNQLQEEMLC